MLKFCSMGSSGRGNQNSSDNLMKALTDRTQSVVHLTHNDLDAAGSDAIHRLKFGEVFTVWASVGRFPSLLGTIAGAPGRGDTLSISDLGCPREIEPLLRKARSNGWRIEWRDHHRWRDEEATLVNGLVDCLHLDTATCATGICSRDLLPGDDHGVEIARLVCDYDLWKHEDPRSKVLGQVVMRRPNRDYVRDCLMRGEFTDARIEQVYADIIREMEADIRRSIRHVKRYNGKFDIIFAPLYGYPSETAHTIRDEFGTDVEVIVSKSGKFSIRSEPPVSHLIARAFGGGGHPNAAGGHFEFTLLDRLSFFLFKKTRHYERLMAVADTL